MKYFIYKSTLTIGIIALLTYSCSDPLDIKPSSMRTGENFITSDENAIMAVNAIYNEMAKSHRWGNGRLESNYSDIGEMLADFSEMGSVKGDYDDLERMIEWRPYTDEIILDGIWQRCYTGIYKANYVLVNLPEAPIDESLKKRLMAEALFLRGHFFLRLVKVFGSVPLPTDIVYPSEYSNSVQETVHDGYLLAADDFLNAIPDLPEKSQYAPDDLGRATKGAAKAMLARLYLFQVGMDKEASESLWESVYKYSNEVITSGQYDLANNYATIFEPEGENNIESIFEVQYGASASLNQGIGAGTSAVGTTIQIRNGIRGAENKDLPGGWGYFQPTQLLVDEFEKGDPRLSSSVYGPNYNGGIVYGIPRNYDLGQMQSEYYNRKIAIDPVSEAASLSLAPSNGARNVRVIRYADVVLMHAESAYHLGKTGEAQNDLEKIRERARNSTYCKGYNNGSSRYTPTGKTNVLPKVTASGSDLLEAIWHERAVELALESQRYWDLVRTGRYLERLDVIRANSKDPLATELRFANLDLRANCEARCIEGPRGIKDIPVFPLPGVEAMQWNLKQLVDIYQ